MTHLISHHSTNAMIIAMIRRAIHTVTTSRVMSVKYKFENIIGEDVDDAVDDDFKHQCDITIKGRDRDC